MKNRQGIAAGGNWIIDQVKVIDHWPQEEHLVSIISESRGTGGAPYNVLAGLRALDPDIILQAIGIVGHDAFGNSILQHLIQLEIESGLMLQTSLRPTSYTDVMTSALSGKRTFFHNRGANSLLGGEDFEFDKISAKILHLGYLMLLDELDAPDPGDRSRTCAARVLEEACDSGIATSLDMVSDLSDRLHMVVKPTLPYVDYFIANELESGALAEFELRGADDSLNYEKLPDTAGALFDRGVRKLVVIHMPEGGFWYHRESGTQFFQTSIRMPQDKIKGNAGAGDAFCGGILYGIHQGWQPEKTMQLAVAHAARCLMDYTTTAGLASLESTMALIDEFGFHAD